MKEKLPKTNDIEKISNYIRNCSKTLISLIADKCKVYINTQLSVCDARLLYMACCFDDFYRSLILKYINSFCRNGLKILNINDLLYLFVKTLVLKVKKIEIYFTSHTI